MTSVRLQAHVDLGRVLSDLGRTVLTLEHGGSGRTAEIRGIVIYDRAEDLEECEGAVVLGTGLRTDQELIDLLEALAAKHAVAVTVRSPAPASPRVRAAADRAEVAVLSLHPGVSWSRLVAMLGSLIAEPPLGSVAPAELGELPCGDLFVVADTVATLVDAPITIEDRNSRVLAYSGRQEEADPSRIATVLGRRVPEQQSRRLIERGAFRALYRSDEPIHIDPSPPYDDPAVFSMPRVAVAVRAGDEVLGSLWAAVPEPWTRDRLTAFRDAASLVALHLLRERAEADDARRLRADLVTIAIEARADAPDALRRLHLNGQPLVVLALGMTASSGQPTSTLSEAAMARERERLGDALAVHLSALHPRATAALIGDTAYGLLPVPGRLENAEMLAVTIAAKFLGRIGSRIPAAIGVGDVATDVSGLVRSRANADRALRVLRAEGSTQRAARLEDVQGEAWLHDLRDLISARGELPSGPIARLLAYDEQHNAHLVETFRAWADSFGDVVAASESLYVHPNTLRYRLRRLAEISGLDLEDPRARFNAILQLRLISP